MYIDWTYIILVLPAVLFTMWASANVKSTYNKYSRQQNSRGMTGAQAARRVLDANGLQNVAIQQIDGELTDHYDPAQDYVPVKIRSAIIPVTNFGSKLSWPLVLAGLLLCSVAPDFIYLAYIGVACFALCAVFQLVTLPVEFNASSRAMQTIESMGILYGDELTGARRVLRAAAMTYVAALAVTLMQLLRLIIMVSSRDRRR